MISVRVVRDPAGRGALCVPCGAYWPSSKRAERCHPTPVCPGDTMRPSRPTYVPQDATYVPFTPHTYGKRAPLWARVCLAVGLVLAAIAAAYMVGAVLMPAAGVGGPPATIPTTYGPPASTGGPVLAR